MLIQVLIDEEFDIMIRIERFSRAYDCFGVGGDDEDGYDGGVRGDDDDFVEVAGDGLGNRKEYVKVW